MSAWDKLLSASSLAIGTAWQLISSPKMGGSGALIYIESINVAVLDDSVAASIADDTVLSTQTDNTITSAVSITDAATGITDDMISVRTL